MKLSKKSVFTAAAALLLAVSVAGCGKVSVGYVDQDRLNEDCPQIKTTLAEWQGKMDELRTESEKQMSDAAASGASDEEITKLQQQIQMKVISMNQGFQNQMRAKVDAAINEVAKEKGIDVVLHSDEQDKVVISGGIDITDDIINKLQ